MAEIKSTLDLVMERTRNLTMSEEDRRQQSAAEFRDDVNRLIQKYLQNEIDGGRFRVELEKLESEVPGRGRKAALAEVAKRIDPALDNMPLIRLLRESFQIDASGIEKLLASFAETNDRFAVLASGKILENLKKSGISGSAVIPNANSDKGLIAANEEAARAFQKDLADEIDRLC